MSAGSFLGERDFLPLPSNGVTQFCSISRDGDLQAVDHQHRTGASKELACDNVLPVLDCLWGLQMCFMALRITVFYKPIQLGWNTGGMSLLTTGNCLMAVIKELLTVHGAINLWHTTGEAGAASHVPLECWQSKEVHLGELGRGRERERPGSNGVGRRMDTLHIC